MARKVSVVLNQPVTKLGQQGDLVDVAPGYARNFLIPRGLAAYTTPGILKMVERRREKERQRKIEERQQAEAKKTALATIGRLRIAKQAGEEDAIFGTVTNREVAEVIQQFAAIEVDHRNITLPEIHKLGTYRVDVKLHADVVAPVEIEVVAS